jgi:hypothetical protein
MSQATIEATREFLVLFGSFILIGLWIAWKSWIIPLRLGVGREAAQVRLPNRRATG